MSQYVFRKHYRSFQRNILEQFMSEKELNKLDERYNKAKGELMHKRCLDANNYIKYENTPRNNY